MRVVAGWIVANRLATILLVGYFLLSILVFEQGRTIENQRSLIEQLFGDSMALHATQMHLLHGRERH